MERNYQFKKSPKHIGLVLSGGGTRGIAHIGVIKAMQEAGIEAEYVSGTSAGAIVGGMYAAGLSCDKMLDFFRNANLFSFRNYTYTKPGLLNSDRYRVYFEKVLECRYFDELEKKLFISVTNLITGRNEILNEGNIIDAIVASAAFPGMFSPVELHGDLYADGGITNNFPVEPLEWKCDFTIGSYVNPLKDVSPNDLKNTIGILDRVFHINMFKMESPDFHKVNILILPSNLSNYKTFSLKHMDLIMEIGYNEAKKKIDNYFSSIQS